MVVNTFTFTNSYSRVNRTFMLYGNAVPESSIILISEDDEDELYFDIERIKSESTKYFKANLKGYVISSKLYIVMFTSEDDHSTCQYNCKGVVIRLVAELPLLYTFDKQMEYVIKRNG